jgi:hypothetical protein
MNKHHQVSVDDKAFKEQFEQGVIKPSEFNHQSHVRLAYIYLCESDLEAAYSRMRDSIFKFISHHGIDPQKYHETLTKAWMMAVHHFMSRSPDQLSSVDFIAANPKLSDSKIMLTHYSKERLFAECARNEFVEPDLQPIPKHSFAGSSTH